MTLGGRTAIVLVALLLARPVQAQNLGRPVRVLDPGGQALAHFHEALRRAELGEGTARLLFYGASHTAPDLYTGFLRARLKERFGDAGAGFVLPVLPFPYYDHREVRIENGGPWRTLRVRGRDRVNDAYGLAGFAVETDGQAWGAIEPARASGPGSQVGYFEVYYQERPDGGTLELHLDGSTARVVTTRAAHVGLGYARLDVAEGFHRLEVITRGDGTVRLFGIVMERGAPGVVVDALGIPGAGARDQLPWDESVLREHLQRRAPDLVAFAYGTNESGGRQTMQRYEADLRAVVSRVRTAAPDASCLLIGPSEWPEQRRDGSWVPRARTAQIITVQRRVARQLGCGFFDLVAFTGGRGSMSRWVRADMALSDHVHFTANGHRRLAEVLERALLRGLDRRPRSR